MKQERFLKKKFKNRTTNVIFGGLWSHFRTLTEYNVNSLKITAVNQVDKKNEKKNEKYFFLHICFCFGLNQFLFL